MQPWITFKPDLGQKLIGSAFFFCYLFASPTCTKATAHKAPLLHPGTDLWTPLWTAAAALLSWWSGWRAKGGSGFERLGRRSAGSNKMLFLVHLPPSPFSLLLSRHPPLPWGGEAAGSCGCWGRTAWGWAPLCLWAGAPRRPRREASRLQVSRGASSSRLRWWQQLIISFWQWTFFCLMTSTVAKKYYCFLAGGFMKISKSLFANKKKKKKLLISERGMF